ncbi:cell wall-binding repeat-containing protein [Lagierella sp.]|uniref:cell wall-binding repeat-containing protein n=1 Tax=Lagierella sp. TaxID=2849657 RepID=UPI002622B10A|nr:cell wall-binding repeat-containing protein [Lagierella sp.]
MNRKSFKFMSMLMAISIFFVTIFSTGAINSVSKANDKPVNISSIKGLKGKPLYIKDSRIGTIGEGSKVVFKNENDETREFTSKYNDDTGLYYFDLNFDLSGSWNLVQDTIDGALDSNEFSVDIYENLEEMTGESTGYVLSDVLEGKSSIIGEDLENLLSTIIGYDAQGEYAQVDISISSSKATSNMSVFNNGLSSSLGVEENTYLPAGDYDLNLQVGSYSKHVGLTLLSDYTNKVDLNLEEPVEEDQAQLMSLSSVEEDNVSELSGESSTSAVVNVNRLSGRSRYETAVSISKSKFSSAKSVVLANGEMPNDILVGSSLAGSLNSPILITGKDQLNTSTKSEINRLGAGKIFVIGGLSKISSKVISELKSMGKQTQILDGGSDEGTSVKVASQSQSIRKASALILSSKDSLPDSLSASALAANKGYPILYTFQKSVPNAVKNYINSSGVSTVIVVGGDSTIDNSVITFLRSLGKNVVRVSGRSRYDTSLAIANKYFPSVSELGVATGREFVDSLTSGPVSGLKNQPTILVSDDNISSGLKKYVQNTKAKTVTVYGGNKWVSDAFISNMKGYLNQLYNTSDVLDVTGNQKPTTKVRIMLDPGHGAGSAHNRGYVGPRWNNEGDGNYHFSLLLAKELRKYGIEVNTTRSSIWKDPGLATRGKLGASHNLFISLHTNAANSKASGVEIYEDVDRRATTLANQLTRTISSTLGIGNRGVKYRYYGDNTDGVDPKSNFYGVLRNNKASAGMLIEHCFHDNMDDVLKYEKNAEILAANMAKTIARYFGLTK